MKIQPTKMNSCIPLLVNLKKRFKFFSWSVIIYLKLIPKYTLSTQ